MQENVIDMSKKMKMKKRKVPAMGMVVFPPPKETIVWFSNSFSFSYSLSHLCLLAFTFGYIDCNSFYRFHLYSTMQTGNFISAALLLTSAGTNTETSFPEQAIQQVMAVCICNTFFGPLFSCAVLEYFDNREKAYAW